ncbi:amidohydrolase family protein [Bradyrhizobium sp. LHD-71]|uniref:amidohydrolase family protein n=1 Tax=Bradyrhizobium sp. LHD-71 TaxID=3072141 RepID=UPI00280C466F|nr:amidohydrolase family protein [Bradyrhizobium sp. LHD-71]MDQ8729341.1 amidohydrolase family protein [Bradyrhizobium sp. LHD-71]
MPLIDFCSCGCGSKRSSAPPTAAHVKTFTVDLHAHVLDLTVEQLLADHPGRARERNEAAQTLGAESAAYNAKVLAPRVAEPLTRVERRLADMDEMGVAMQVLSPAPTQYYYWAEPPLAEDIVERQNCNLGQLCRQHPGRFLALGNVALQHPKLAVAQLRRAVRDHGLLGVEVSSAVQGLELADPAFEEFWAAASELECVVFIHPLGSSVWPRLDSQYLTNVVGQPLETTIALSRLIFAGVLDRHQGLRILAAHGGGYLPSYVGRSQHAWCVRPDARTTSERPLAYLKRMWFDSIVYEPLGLRHLIDVVGLSQIVVGSDYPYDMGMYDIHGFLAEVPGLTTAEVQQICHSNAERLTGRRLA